eukprot:3727742-Amphidinium_carterae.1
MQAGSDGKDELRYIVESPDPASVMSYDIVKEQLLLDLVRAQWLVDSVKDSSTRMASAAQIVQ